MRPTLCRFYGSVDIPASIPGAAGHGQFKDIGSGVWNQPLNFFETCSRYCWEAAATRQVTRRLAISQRERHVHESLDRMEPMEPVEPDGHLRSLERGRGGDRRGGPTRTSKACTAVKLAVDVLRVLHWGFGHAQLAVHMCTHIILIPVTTPWCHRGCCDPDQDTRISSQLSTKGLMHLLNCILNIVKSY